MSNNIIKRLLQGRFKLPKALRETLQLEKPPLKYAKHNWRRQPKYIKGISNGNYFRIKVPPKRQRLPDVPKLPSPNPMPKAFTSSPPSAEKVVKAATAEVTSGSRRRVIDWLRSNLPILVLNFGSMCTLIGFTRSDVLELRSLSITGNIMFVGYALGQNPILWPSIAWSLLFASVNGVKIFEIVQERTAEVHMTEEQENVFVEHFMPHGITPKQFERIEAKAKTVKIKKGEFLARKGVKLEKVSLVIKGSTNAHVLGRHLTAASTNQDTKGSQKAGGDSGAWVGEMQFLDYFWEKEQGKDPSNVEESENKKSSGKVSVAETSKKGLGFSIYTIVADEDCTVMTWSHDDMEELMQSSGDMRAALTRAMTSALVGKVVNLTVSRSNSGILPKWSNWLASDKTTSFGGKVEVKSSENLPEDREQKPTPKVSTDNMDPMLVAGLVGANIGTHYKD